MWKFIKNWTLPLAMLVGTLGYFLLTGFSILNPLKPLLNDFLDFLIPVLIFTQLLLTFCKVKLRDLKPVSWHGWLLIVQLLSSGLIALLLIGIPLGVTASVSLQGAMVCFLCPTATAAAVITGRLGGSVSSLTTYTLFSNLLAAVVVPWLFPLVEPHDSFPFITAFLKILGKVFPLLLSPFILALLLRWLFPPVHHLLLKCHGVAFYLWAIALAVVTGQTVHSMVNSSANLSVLLLVVMAGLFSCIIQFAVGKCIGSHYDDRISAGQALGQKNTILAIWMACTYLNPLSSLAPGSYVVWQNLFNSWQLWKKRRM